MASLQRDRPDSPILTTMNINILVKRFCIKQKKRKKKEKKKKISPLFDFMCNVSKITYLHPQKICVSHATRKSNRIGFQLLGLIQICGFPIFLASHK